MVRKIAKLPVCLISNHIEVSDHRPSHCKCPASGKGLWRQGCLPHRYKWASFGSASTAVTLVHSERRMHIRMSQTCLFIHDLSIVPTYMYIDVHTVDQEVLMLCMYVWWLGTLASSITSSEAKSSTTFEVGNTFNSFLHRTKSHTQWKSHLVH